MQTFGSKIGNIVDPDAWFVDQRDIATPKKYVRKKPVSSLEKLHKYSIDRMEEALELIDKGNFQERLPTLDELANNPELDIEWDPTLRDCTYHATLKTLQII